MPLVNLPPQPLHADPNPNTNTIINSNPRKHYYDKNDAVIFVVDSSDRDRIGQAGEEIRKLMVEDQLRDSLLLVYLNKQDLPHAMDHSSCIAKLGLDTLKGRTWYAQPAVARNGDGLYEGLDWLSRELGNRT
jgi:hypothetical protein